MVLFQSKFALMTIEESSYAHIMNNKIKYHCEALHFGLTY